MFDLARLDEQLAGTLFAGQVHYRAVSGSTNADAREAALSGAAHGSVFLAGQQQAGRGRGDHSWHSPAGEGLYVSVLLRPAIPATRLAFLPLAAGLAVSSAIESVTGCRAQLRWPNDVLVGPRKVCGILADAKIEPDGVRYAVVGIGINVHQQDFPAELAAIATSLDRESGRRIDHQQLLVALLQSLQREAEGLTGEGACESIPRRLAEASSWVRGKEVEVHGPQACRGVTEGLDENGFLLVRTATELVRVQTGGIRAVE